MNASDLHGIVPALVTPLSPDGSLDRDGCRRVAEHVLKGGVHGALALGSTGEVHAFDTATRHEIVALYAETLAGRVPLLVGVARTNVAEASDDIEAAAASGAVAALVTPPYYAPVSQSAVLRFYDALSQRAHIPIFVYNIPGFTKVVVEPATVAALARAGTVAGIKDSGRDFEYLERVLALTAGVAGFRTFVGTDTFLLAALLMGASGAITLTSNLAPALAVRLYDLHDQGWLHEARDLQFQLLDLTLALRIGAFPAAIKAGLALIGVCEDIVAAPTERLSAADRDVLAEAMRRVGLLPIPV